MSFLQYICFRNLIFKRSIVHTGNQQMCEFDFNKKDDEIIKKIVLAGRNKEADMENMI